MIAFTCGECKLALTAPDEMAGEKMQCPRCKARLRAPGTAAAGRATTALRRAGAAMEAAGFLLTLAGVGCGFWAGFLLNAAQVLGWEVLLGPAVQAALCGCGGVGLMAAGAGMRAMAAMESGEKGENP